MITPNDVATRSLVASRSAIEPLASTVDAAIGIVGGVPVGMPNGEPANVGPTAAVLGHTAIAWNDLSPQVETLIISNSMANAVTETVTLPDFEGNATVYKVFRKLNVLMVVSVQTNTPILITDSKIGQLFIQTTYGKVRSHWNAYTRAPARTGDRVLTAAMIWDGTDTTIPSTASWNGARQVGSGANIVGPLGDGVFTDAVYRCASHSSELIAYRDNCMGCTDMANLNALGRMRFIEVWDHDHIWFPFDAARSSFNPPQTHYDTVKINNCRGLELIDGRSDHWPFLASDYPNISAANHFKGPHWGKSPRNVNWPARRTSGGTTSSHVGTAGVISNQAFSVPGTTVAATINTITLSAGSAEDNDFYNGMTIVIGTQQNVITDYNGTTKVASLQNNWATIPSVGTQYKIATGSRNILVYGWRFDGPVNDWFQFGKGSQPGATPQDNITIAACVFADGVDQLPAYDIPNGDYLIGNLGDNWHWKATGPTANRDGAGNPIPIPKAGMIDSDSFTPDAAGVAAAWDPTLRTHSYRHSYSVTNNIVNDPAPSMVLMNAQLGPGAFNTSLMFDGVQPTNTGRWEKLFAQINSPQGANYRFIDGLYGIEPSPRGGSHTVAEVIAETAEMNAWGDGSRDASLIRAARGLLNGFVSQDYPGVTYAGLTLRQFSQVIIRFCHENNGWWYPWGYIIRASQGFTTGEINTHVPLLCAAYKSMWERVLFIFHQELGDDRYSRLTWSWNVTCGAPNSEDEVNDAWPTNVPPGTSILLTYDDYIELPYESPPTAQIQFVRNLMVEPNIINRFVGVGVDESGPHCYTIKDGHTYTAAEIAAAEAVMDVWVRDHAVFHKELALANKWSHVNLWEIDEPNGRKAYCRTVKPRKAVLPGCTTKTFIDAAGIARTHNYKKFPEQVIAEINSAP